MSDQPELTIHIDGAARGNPGPAAFAFVIEQAGRPTVEQAGKLGHTTNNIAEYTALVRLLHYLESGPPARLLILSDSELLVKQMRGEYAVKNADLRELYDEAKQLLRHHRGATFRHVPRAQNKRADELCNEALDGKPSGGPPAAKPKPAKKGTANPAAVRDDAVTCLRAALESWGRGDASRPSAEAVFEQLWSVLDEGGVLKRAKA
jgi:ribonuclease HI